MKFYTLDFDCNVPTTQQVNIPTNSDYRVGVKVTRNGKKVDLQPGDVTLGDLSADSGLTNGYVTFTKATGDFASMDAQALNIAYNPPVASATLTGTAPRVQQKSVFCSLSAYEGKGIPLDEVEFVNISRASTEPEFSDAEIAAGWQKRLLPENWPQGGAVNLVEFARDGSGVSVYPKWYYPSKVWDADNRAKTPEELSTVVDRPLPPAGVPYVLKLESSGSTQLKVLTELVPSNYTLLLIATSFNKQRFAIGARVNNPALNTSFKLIENVYKSQQGDIDLVGDTSGFYTKGETDAMLSAKADESELTAYAGKSELSAYAGKSDVLTKEQLSVMLAPVKNTSTGYVKDLSAVTSADVVSCLYNIGAELFGVPPPPVYGLPPNAFPVQVVDPGYGSATFTSNGELAFQEASGGKCYMYGHFPDVGWGQICTFDSNGVFESTTTTTLTFNGLDPIPGERPVLGWY